MCFVSAENTPELPHKVVSGVQTPSVEALACSLYSVLLTIFKWSVVFKCSFAGSSADSTVGQLSRKIISGWGKKNKLAKGCSLQVASGSVVRRFNCITAQLDPAEGWGGFSCWTKSVIWRVWGGGGGGGGDLYTGWKEGDCFPNY